MIEESPSKKLKIDPEIKLMKEINICINIIHQYNLLSTNRLIQVLRDHPNISYTTDPLMHILERTQTLDDMGPVVKLIHVLIRHGVNATDSVYWWVDSSINRMSFYTRKRIK